MRRAIGIIETTGLVAAVEAADASVKAANVRLIGYELTKGGGLVTVKMSGDVGAVHAAVAAGSAAAAKVNKVNAVLVLARPHEDLDAIIHTPENIIRDEPTEPPTPSAPQDPPEPTEPSAEPEPYTL